MWLRPKEFSRSTSCTRDTENQPGNTQTRRSNPAAKRVGYYGALAKSAFQTQPVGLGSPLPYRPPSQVRREQLVDLLNIEARLLYDHTNGRSNPKFHIIIPKSNRPASNAPRSWGRHSPSLATPSATPLFHLSGSWMNPSSSTQSPIRPKLPWPCSYLPLKIN